MEALTDIVKAWSEGVASDYASGSVVSERSLQASLYYNLRTLASNITVYVEPKVLYKGSSPSRIPDLVVSANGQAVAIIEIKFFPWWRPKDKDIAADIDRLNKLKALPSHKKLNLAIDPRTGDFVNQEKVHDNAIYVFGIVGQDVRSALEQYSPWTYGSEDLRPLLHVLFGDVSEIYETGMKFGHIRPDAP